MIEGVVIKKLEKFKDERGWLAEIYRNDEIDPEADASPGIISKELYWALRRYGAGYKPAMAYFSESKPGVARGPHEHKEQTDFFIFIGPGKFRVYLWDNRKESATFGEKIDFEVGGEEITSVLVPPGVVHGYKCVSEIPALCLNLPDKLYRGENKKEGVDEVRYEEDTKSEFKI